MTTHVLRQHELSLLALLMVGINIISSRLFAVNPSWSRTHPVAFVCFLSSFLPEQPLCPATSRSPPKAPALNRLALGVIGVSTNPPKDRGLKRLLSQSGFMVNDGGVPVSRENKTSQ